MSYDGSGTYSRTTSGTPYVTGTSISSTVVNNELTDIATALTNCICKDGQSTVSSNLPMATHRHTGVGNSVARTDYASAADVQDGTLIYLTSVSGTNTITATAANSMSAYATGQKFHFIVGTTNTSSVTININSIGAKAITKNGTTALSGGELYTGVVAIIIYDGTQFQLVNYQPITAASGYTKIAPNYYKRTIMPNLYTGAYDFHWTTSGDVTLAAPSGAAYVVLRLMAIGNTDFFVKTFNEALRTNIADLVDVANGTSTVDIIAPVISGTIYATVAVTSSGNAYGAIYGYYT